MGILNRLQLWWNWLTTDPLGFALYLLYFAVSVLLTLILHEIAHGYVAYRCGDPTAKMLGRLSLDPRKHLDPIGTLCLVFLGFGWISHIRFKAFFSALKMPVAPITSVTIPITVASTPFPLR